MEGRHGKSLTAECGHDVEGTAGQDENSAFNSVVLFQAVMIIPVSSSQSEALCVYFVKHMLSPERPTKDGLALPSVSQTGK